MKRIKISVYLIVYITLLLGSSSCKKNDTKIQPAPTTAETEKAVKDFLRQQVSSAAYESFDFEKKISYHLKDNITAIRIPIKNKDLAKDYVLVASLNTATWFGNYVSVIKNDSSAVLTYSIKTTSFDSSRVELNTSAMSRPALLAAPVINLGVPGANWLGFLYSLQEQYPSAFANWYYPENGPTPVTSGGGSNVINYDPYIGDNIIIDRKLRDSFPCIVRLLDTISAAGNLTSRAQVALNQIFNVGKKIHLTLRVENSWTKDSIDGATTVDSAWTTTLADGTEGLDFYAKIALNPWLLKNATKEYIASTIIHEAFHAYIDYKYLQYRKGIIDSNAFKTLFPLYWPPRYLAGTGIYIMPTNLLQHQVMAANLIQAMASPLYGLSNNSMSPVMKDSLYRALSWGGLEASTTWRTKTDTCNIMAINRVARDTSYGLGHSQGPFIMGNCLTNYTFSYSSLNFKMPCQ